MSRKGWIITLVAVGAGLAIVVGAFANSKSRQEQQYCDALSSLESSLTALDSLNAHSASQDEVQSDISAVQSDWSDVKSDASKVHDSNESSLDSAWSDFESAVGNLNNGGSVSDVQSAAKGLAP